LILAHQKSTEKNKPILVKGAAKQSTSNPCCGVANVGIR
jgi:hypothetical protein